jgi:hypothetical protein
MTRTAPPTSAHSPRVLVADLDHRLMTATVAFSVVGLLLLLVGWTVAGTLCGAAGLLTGLAAQMVSRTRGERWVDVAGMLAAFLVLAIGASQGGLG